MLKETVNNEISNLFQELIVSKINKAINELCNKITQMEEVNDEINDRIDKLPKLSGIKKFVDRDKNEIISHIDKCFERNDTEKYLKDIVEEIKKQFGFSEKQVLCTYLETLSENVGNRIDNIVNSQQSINERINSVDKLIDVFKKELIDTIIGEQKNAVLKINESLNGVIDSENEIKEKIKSSVEHINTISEKTDEVIGLLTDNLSSLSDASRERNEIRNQLEQLYSSIEKKMEFKIKALTIISSISAAGIVVLAILQLFI